VDKVGRDRGDIHPDAELIHETVLLFPVALRALVISHAKTGTRPEAATDARPSMAPVYNGRGEIAKIWNENRNIVGCKVRVVQTQEAIDYVQKWYRDWHAALNGMADYFNEKRDLLTSHYPTPVDF
ncbi:MAG: hypothetical protein V7727_19800, partial [Sneathiella sp.]